jgi:hypothetical protein
MIRGLVPKDRLLEWTVHDVWPPLCEFLGKPIPEEPFPHVNTAAGFEGQESRIAKRYLFGAVRTLVMLARLLWDQGLSSSNMLSSDNEFQSYMYVSVTTSLLAYCSTLSRFLY